jgi:hypothetical protein
MFKMILALQAYDYQNSRIDSGHELVLSVNAQTENGTFVLWRINAVEPGQKLEVSITDDIQIWAYKLTVPYNLTTHPNNPEIKYYDYSLYLPTTLKEDHMVMMCVRLQYEDVGYQCTETFVTKNMARGIVYGFETVYNPDVYA